MALTSVETFYSLEDDKTVIDLLEKHRDSVLIVAGGTFLQGLVSRDLLTGIDAPFDIQKLGLDHIQSGADGFEIGAMTKFAQLKTSADIQNTAWLGAIKDATLSYRVVM